MADNKFFTVGNDGKKITETNYWDQEVAKNGYFYLSSNAGAIRMLVPKDQDNVLDELCNCDYVIISEGVYEGRKGMLELLFEDNSDIPYTVFMSGKQSDFSGVHGEFYDFLIYSESRGLIKETTARYRNVGNLPHMRSWS